MLPSAGLRDESKLNAALQRRDVLAASLGGAEPLPAGLRRDLATLDLVLVRGDAASAETQLATLEPKVAALLGAVAVLSAAREELAQQRALIASMGADPAVTGQLSAVVALEVDSEWGAFVDQNAQAALRGGHNRIIEAMAEVVRHGVAPDKPSRLACLYAYRDLALAQRFRDEQEIPGAPIWLVESESDVPYHESDSRLLGIPETAARFISNTMLSTGTAARRPRCRPRTSRCHWRRRSGSSAKSLSDSTGPGGLQFRHWHDAQYLEPDSRPGSPQIAGGDSTPSARRADPRQQPVGQGGFRP